MTVAETGRRAGVVSYDSFDVTTLTPHLGAEVQGLDLSQPLDDRQLSDLHQAFADWSVLVFRDQHLDREAHSIRHSPTGVCSCSATSTSTGRPTRRSDGTSGSCTFTR